MRATRNLLALAMTAFLVAPAGAEISLETTSKTLSPRGAVLSPASPKPVVARTKQAAPQRAQAKASPKRAAASRSPTVVAAPRRPIVAATRVRTTSDKLIRREPFLQRVAAVERYNGSPGCSFFCRAPLILGIGF